MTYEQDVHARVVALRAESAFLWPWFQGYLFLFGAGIFLLANELRIQAFTDWMGTPGHREWQKIENERSLGRLHQQGLDAERKFAERQAARQAEIDAFEAAKVKRSEDMEHFLRNWGRPSPELKNALEMAIKHPAYFKKKMEEAKAREIANAKAEIANAKAN